VSAVQSRPCPPFPSSAFQSVAARAVSVGRPPRALTLSVLCHNSRAVPRNRPCAAPPAGRRGARPASQRPCPLDSSRASCLGTSGAPSRARWTGEPGCSRLLMEARCSSMRSGICRWQGRRCCCGFFRSGKCGRSGARTRFMSTCAIAATNNDLERAIERGEFRADLYDRLSEIVLRAPALRDRPDDIPMLMEHFIAWHSLRHKVAADARCRRMLPWECASAGEGDQPGRDLGRRWLSHRGRFRGHRGRRK
jgi:hypothetical protein